MKKQVIYIHGGNSFEDYEKYLEHLKNSDFDPFYERNKKWKHSLEEDLGEGFEVFMPTMPSGHNAKYIEWKIWFEKLIPFVEDNVVIIGHSLGAIFIAKYLSENNLPKKILATYLLAGPYDNDDSDDSLADFVLPESLSMFEESGGKIFLYHSKDDPVVPFVNVEKYAKHLLSAEKVIFEDRGHFNQEEFPELIESIKQLY